MKLQSILFLAFTFMIFQSCTKGDFITELNFEAIDVGDYSEIKNTSQQEFETKAEWEDFWVNSLSKDINTIPSVEFESEIVVALFLGERPTGGYQISTDKIEEFDNGLEVRYFETVPTGIVTQAFTYPYQIIKFAQTDKKITYIKN